MKDGKLKTQPSLLENLIFFVEVSVLPDAVVMDIVLRRCHYVCVPFFFSSTDGVYSFVDGEPLHQGPPTAQDESAEEEEEEEKGDEH